MLISMGKKHKTEGMAQPMDKPHVSYPSFSLSGDLIPDELANKKVGQMCRLEILVKKVGDSVSSYDNGEQRIELEIHKLGYVGGKVGKEEYDKMSEEEKNKADEKDVMGDDEE